MRCRGPSLALVLECATDGLVDGIFNLGRRVNEVEVLSAYESSLKSKRSSFHGFDLPVSPTIRG